MHYEIDSITFVFMMIFSSQVFAAVTKDSGSSSGHSDSTAITAQSSAAVKNAGGGLTSLPNHTVILLKNGQDTMKLNGKTVTIEKPYTVKNTTLVPLRVITSAFGAQVQWVASTQGIILTHQGKTIELHVGQTSATVDGKKVQLPVAPQMKNGTTMIPIRFISEDFGATVQFDSKTSSIMIVGASSPAAAGQSEYSSKPSIIEDQGKTKVGDSYFSWSMNYPTGLDKVNQSFRGDEVDFSDINGKYSVSVFIAQNSRIQSTEDALQALIKMASNTTVLEQKTYHFIDAPDYAQIIAKTSKGGYEIVRSYVQNKKSYFLDFIINKAADYKNKTTYNNYLKLINSFRPTFNANDPKIKDISVVNNGYITYIDTSYGLLMDFPAIWDKSTDSGNLYFYDTNNSFNLNMKMTSVNQGETLQKWAQWEGDTFQQTYADDYRQMSDLHSTTIAGVPAAYRTMDYSFDKKQWHEMYDVYLIKGNYKLNFTFEYKKDAATKDKPLIQHMLQSIVIDMDLLKSNFGFIQDTNELNWSKTRHIQSQTYHYSIDLPKIWSATQDNNDSSDLSYQFIGGNFSLVTDKTMSYKDAVNRVDYFMDNSKKLNSNFKLYSKESVQIHGVTGTKYVYSGTNQDGSIYKTTSYVLNNNGVTYLIDMVADLAVSTSHLNQQFTNIMDSLKLD